MKYFSTKPAFVFALLCLLFTSCVSKKKHLKALKELRSINENVVNEWQKKYNDKRRELTASEDKARQLELDLAERKGENNILLTLRRELEIQIENMEMQLNSMGSSSKSVELNLRKTMVAKNDTINDLRNKLSTVNTVLQKNQDLLSNVLRNLSFEIDELGFAAIEIIMRNNQVVVILPEKTIFKYGSSSRITDSGDKILQSIGAILNRFPQLVFQVNGHTDNTPANVKRYKDNWNFSALQAAAVVRTFVSEYDINPSQMTVGGKGEFEPRASNASADGKRLNRRIELIIYRPGEDLAKEVKAITGGF
ncbi:MAG: OmpA family protein [Bacteroidota bacterium]